MALSQEQFDALVKRLEGFARQQPATYKLRVALLALLGYAYVFLILAGLLAILWAIAQLVLLSGRINALILKLAILVLIPVFVILRSLWVTFPPPTGLELSRVQVPRLFALIDELTSALKAPPFHRVLLTSDFNAGVLQIPRLGIFGWQQNYLLIGLPLMQALSPEQFRAVLAHEFGHLSGNHSRFAGWIYRVRKTWVQLLERLHRGGHGGSFAVFEGFFNWYAPFFSAYSFVLARMDEYEADRCACQLAGAQNTAEALINVEVRAKFLESQFWPTVYKQVDRQVEPPAATFTNMSRALRADVKLEDGSKWFNQALAQKTSNADTHPCLSDRLSALGYSQAQREQLSLAAKLEVSAAQQFLGNALKQLTDHFDRAWKEEVATPWRQRYAYAQEVQKKLQALEEKAQNQPLTAEEAWNRASWTAEFKGKEAAIPLIKEILATQPNHASANYALGQILLEENDASGIGYIEKAIETDLETVIPGCELIDFFLKQQGKIEEAKAYQKRAQQHYNLLMKARQERSFVIASDQFQPHNLTDAQVQELCQQLSGYERLKEAYLVQKVVQYFPEKPFYVLGVKRDRRFFESDSSGHDNQLVERLANEVQFPGNAYIIILNDNTKNLGKKLRGVEGSLIYKG